MAAQADVEALVATFAGRGWNRGGSCLLAAAVVVAREQGWRARRTLLHWDIVPIAIIFLVLANYRTDLLFIHLVLSLTYLLKKLNKVSVDVLVENLDRCEQKELVLRLVDLCQAKQVDHENLDQLWPRVREDLGPKVSDVLRSYVNEKTQFRIL